MRFLRCAARVREIRNHERNNAEARVLKELVTYNGGVTFLPSLHALRWLETPHTRGLLHVIASPSLVSLTYDIEENVSPEQIKETIYQMGRKVPNLSSLSTTNRPNDISLIPLLSAFKFLRNLTVRGSQRRRGLTAQDLAALPSLSALQSLACTIDSEALTDSQALITAPHLLNLRIFYPTTRATLVDFFPKLGAPLLENVDISIREQHADYDPVQNRALLDAVTSAVDSRLVALTFHTEGMSDHVRTDVPFPPLLDVLAPALRLSHIRRVDIKYRWITSLTNDALLVLAQAWPHLEVLSVDIVNYAGPFPTQTALSHFARHCARLTRLSLALPLNILAEAPAPPAAALISAHPLRGLRFQIRTWETERVAPEELGRFLDMLFPNLVLGESNRNQFPAMVRLREGWEQMWNQVEALQKERRA
ncbi:hypothetical protein C8Q80DRAFT_1274925 [Daedaleopsis nitida]|nr:hypothetical protein C8Q80DRAFT_1274925 [Daedaleopsis nitida]